MKKYIISLLISLPLWAGPIPKACYKDAKSTFSKSVAKSIFDPRVFILQEAKLAHKFNQIRAAIKSANTGKLSYMSKLMAKNVGMKNNEFLIAIKKNPQIFCNKKNKLNSPDEIWWSLTKYKIKPRIMAKLRSIQKHCSPQAIIKKGNFSPNRFQFKITDQMKELAKGSKRYLGKSVKGRYNRPTWIYNSENGFSDPVIQKGKNYQYLIHGIRSTHSVGLHEHALISAKTYLNELTKTSLSLVDQDDTYPFTRGIGILVKPDPKTIWAAHTSNMASDHQSLKRLNGSYPIRTPEELLNARKYDKITMNNEIVSLKGNDVIGYYLFKRPGSKNTIWYLYDVNKLEVLEKACRKNNLPVININLSGKGYL